jgi:hypothetical protein
MASRPGPRPTHDVMENLPSFKGTPSCPRAPAAAASAGALNEHCCSRCSCRARPRLHAWRAGGGQAAPDRMCGRTFMRGVSAPSRAVPAGVEQPASLGRSPRRWSGRPECAARQRPAGMVEHAAGRGVGACAGCTVGAYRSPIAPAALCEQRCRTASAPTCLCGSCGFAASSATFQMEEAMTGIRKSSVRSAACMPASWRLVFAPWCMSDQYLPAADAP